MRASGLSSLVAQAYEAACDTSGMADFVQSTADYFGAQQAAITISPIEQPESMLPITHGISTDEVRGMYADRERPGTVFARLSETPSGETVALDSVGGDIPRITSASLQKTGTTLPDGMNVLAGCVVADEQNRCDLMLFRDPTRGDYSPSEHEALQSLMTYLRRAIDLNKRFVKMFVEHRTALSVLENAQRSIIILGQHGQVNFRNHAAEQLLAADDGLALADDRLETHDENARDTIAAFLERARTTDDSELDGQRLLIAVPRRSGEASYKIVMYKLPFNIQQAKLNDSQPLAVMLVHDPLVTNRLSERMLQHFYNLTHAESALAQAMYDGRTLPEASVELGISVNTARTQLRSIFKKVNVHSQAELLRELTKNFFRA